jgi:hypothetical protein
LLHGMKELQGDGRNADNEETGYLLLSKML